MSGQSSGLTYAVDLVLCIDATGSMAPIIERVKANALKFHDDLMKAMHEKQKKINFLRAKVIFYRDYHDNAAEPLLESPFFSLPDEEARFSDFIKPVGAAGGGDEPESALEALAHAIKSDWIRTGDRRRHVVVLWTDASAHRLEDAASKGSRGYPTDLPGSFGEFIALWEGQSMERGAKRMLLYGPDAYPWNDIMASCENTVHIVSKAGDGLAEFDYSQVLEAIANSI
jgi:hypothetical protein